VTVWDVGCERQVEIAGKDALAFANRLTPRDLTTCAVGQGKYAVITSEEGGIVGDPVLLRVAKDRLWLSVADSDVLLWAKGVALHAGMDVDISEPDVSPIQIQGPKAKDVLKALVGPKVLDLPYYRFMEATVDGIPVLVTRTGWSAEVGYEIYLRDSTRWADIWEKDLTDGRPFDLRPTGPSEARRIEAGILNCPSDIHLGTNPFEVGLGWQVEEGKKADYIGKKALGRIRKEGPKRKLVGVEIGGPPFRGWVPEYWPVTRDGKAIGTLTAGAYSPRLEKNIGYAMVPIRFAKLGTTFTVTTPMGDRDATVVKKPFIDPKKEIPKS
ncbi:MAG: glycine cleavage T C-terminal barrel domain-containing protein, partial [Methanobacteriota archaeon]